MRRVCILILVGALLVLPGCRTLEQAGRAAVVGAVVVGTVALAADAVHHIGHHGQHGGHGGQRGQGRQSPRYCR